jgi:hypothetical protein
MQSAGAALDVAVAGFELETALGLDTGAGLEARTDDELPAPDLTIL